MPSCTTRPPLWRACPRCRCPSDPTTNRSGLQGPRGPACAVTDPGCGSVIPIETDSHPSQAQGAVPETPKLIGLEMDRESLRRAEGEGFEPSMAYAMPVFKTGAIGHSATPPIELYY